MKKKVFSLLATLLALSVIFSMSVFADSTTTQTPPLNLPANEEITIIPETGDMIITRCVERNGRKISSDYEVNTKLVDLRVLPDKEVSAVLEHEIVRHGENGSYYVAGMAKSTVKGMYSISDRVGVITSVKSSYTPYGTVVEPWSIDYGLTGQGQGYMSLKVGNTGRYYFTYRVLNNGQISATPS